MKKKILAFLCILACLSMLVACGDDSESSETSDGEDAILTAEDADAEANKDAIHFAGYNLDKVIVLSRHNIRSPLTDEGSLLADVTPHEWFNWSSASSELSLRGGILETEMGQYFRKWLEVEGLFPENYRPQNDEVRIYANSKQRTIASAEYFTAGLLPVGNANIEYHVDYDTMDPVFTPQITFTSPAYEKAVKDQINELYKDKLDALYNNYDLLMDVLDFEETDAYKKGDMDKFTVGDDEIILEVAKEPGSSGSLRTACTVSDALVLQYYEENDDSAAAFGHELTYEDWKEIAAIKDMYTDVWYKPPLIAKNIAHPLLQLINDEMNTGNRKFTFLCGHDTNIGSTLSSLDVADYDLPGSIEKNTPIGAKLVFSHWVNDAGEKFWSVDMIYQTTLQLKTYPLLDLANGPAVYHLEFNGMTANKDGLYTDAEMKARFKEAIDAYDRIYSEYVGEAAPAVEPAA